MSHESDETRHHPDTALITSYLMGDLTAEDRGALRERMRRDPQFREDVMIMTCLRPAREALEDLKAFDERFGSADGIMAELERRRAVRVARRQAARRRVRWLRAASIAGIAVLPPAGMLTARVASLRHGGEPAQALASSTPRGNGSVTSKPPASPPKSAGSGVARAPNTAHTAAIATTARGAEPEHTTLARDLAPMPPVRDGLHGDPTVLAGSPSGTQLLPRLAAASACDAASSPAALARELAQAVTDSVARDSALKGTRGSPLRELWNAVVARGARGAAAAGMHPHLGVGAASAVVAPADSVPPRDSAALKAADSTTKPAAVSARSCDGAAANPTVRRSNP